MQNASSAGRKLTNEERVEVVKRQKKRNSFQLAMLSVIGIPCVINAYTGIKQSSPVLINVAKTCGASNFTVFRKIGIPSAMTMTFAGIRVALGNAWATLVAAEMLAANAGLGYMILQGRQFARADIIILGIVVIGVIGVIFTSVLGLLEKKVLRWKR